MSSSAEAPERREDTLNIDRNALGLHLPSNTSHHDYADTPSIDPNFAAFSSNANLAQLTYNDGPTPTQTHPRKPSEVGLYIETQVPSPIIHGHDHRLGEPFPGIDHGRTQRAQDATPPTRPPIFSHRSFDNISISSANSSIGSPALAALSDVTPLPSPLPGNSPDMWRRFTGRPHSGSASSLAREEAAGLLPPLSPSRPASRHKKQYPSLSSPHTAHDSSNHSNHRSISEFVPETLSNVRMRNVTAPQTTIFQGSELEPSPLIEHTLHREEYRATPRNFTDATRLADPARTLPSPPRSNRSLTDSEDSEDPRRRSRDQSDLLTVKSPVSGISYWRTIRTLGHGAFSEVVLATEAQDEYRRASVESYSKPNELVAIKIVKHDPAGGSSEERMDTSIKREIEMLQCISHPCLPQLKAFDNNDTRALLVLNFCPGGDLFELASEHRSVLTPPMIQRIFSELVGAVRYLHQERIVHRDIKLENILLNIPTATLATLRSPCSNSFPLVTLTDLGLSRRIPEPPASPLLTHPCGSEDYAAPELLLRQPYDGRSTDAWALGVTLYALCEGRLPFDPLPGRRHSSSAKHRIARCDWLWCELGDEDGDWGGNGRCKELEGARTCVEGLLKKRGRWDLDKIAAVPWVEDGIVVEGGGVGLKRKATVREELSIS